MSVVLITRSLPRTQEEISKFIEKILVFQPKKRLSRSIPKMLVTTKNLNISRLGKNLKDFATIANPSGQVISGLGAH